MRKERKGSGRESGLIDFVEKCLERSVTVHSYWATPSERLSQTTESDVAHAVHL
jgi:hypothetical protein